MQKVYAAYYDNEVREKSSSGGLFSLLAQQFDVVYGVAMTEDNYGAKFVRAEKDISVLRGSKYLQASVGDTFKKVKEDLTSGKLVLFTGTGCQVNGLRKFLNKYYENLFCVDVICHGVPSPLLWEMYVKHQESVNGKKVYNVNFRCKEYSWKDFDMKKDAVFNSKDADPFMQMFLRDYCLRPSCYACKAKENKMSDMTIADFWGIDNVVPEMNDDQGVSLVIVRNDKAVDIFEKCKHELFFREVTYENGVRQNPSEYSSAKRPPERDIFFNDMLSMDFNDLSKKYASNKHEKGHKCSLLSKVKRKVKSVLRKGNHNRGGYGILFMFSNDEKESR